MEEWFLKAYKQWNKLQNNILTELTIYKLKIYAQTQNITNERQASYGDKTVSASMQG